MKVVAFVPLKLNNERLPNKNTMAFDNGEPLIQYILNTLKKVNSIDESYVFCSEASIQKYIPDEIIYLSRSENLNLSTTKINEVIQSFVDMVNADIYVLTHATAPFLSAKSFEKGIAAVMSGAYDSAFSVQKFQDFLWDTEKPVNYDLTNIPRTQDLPPVFAETTGLYIFSKELFQTTGRRIGYKPCLIEVSKIEAMDINTIEDFKIANAIYNQILKDKK
jgi:CMP-N-acetylneuraminic acid synthetase